ncbi:hypothetical protein K469DRAFT_715870 [Zopfia rhizophila CBS 207.26]|uniref:Uncharacterized protein n=1 Tax=Zopfia rhizophila CBS 207.26 TaxID=1314779 RepID=A0A6A6DLB8_9PEZI|nr:hypothetical protein K469DRAFT_715870 [Zopfia rhizophila CBS 207.26]
MHKRADSLMDGQTSSPEPPKAWAGPLTSPKKRKATKQVPLNIMFESPSTFKSQRLAFDSLAHLDLELAAKRQRLSERVDSGVGLLPNDTTKISDFSCCDNELLPLFVDFTTGRMDGAHGFRMPPPRTFRDLTQYLGPQDMKKLDGRGVCRAHGMCPASAAPMRIMIEKRRSFRRPLFRKVIRGGARVKDGKDKSDTDGASNEEVSPLKLFEEELSIEELLDLAAEAARAAAEEGGEHHPGHAEGRMRTPPPSTLEPLTPAKSDHEGSFQETDNARRLQQEIQLNYECFKKEKEKANVSAINLDGRDAFEDGFWDDSNESSGMDWEDEEGDYDGDDGGNDGEDAQSKVTLPIHRKERQ